MYDLSGLKELGIDPKEFILCNNRLLKLQEDFLTDLLEFVESCKLPIEPAEFLVKVTENLRRYVVYAANKAENGGE